MFGGKIKRYNIFLMISALLGLLLGGICVACLFVPTMTLKYTESSLTTTVTITGFDFLKALFDRLVMSNPSELGDNFFTFIRDPRSTVFNMTQSFLVTGIGGRAEHLFVLLIALFLLLSILIGIVITIISLIALISGKLHFRSLIKRFARLFFTMFTILVALVFAVNWLYGDIVKAVVNNTSNNVTDGSLSPVWLSVGYLVVSLAVLVLTAVFYKIGLEDKEFVD